MQDIKIAIIQASLEWENISANLAMFEKLMDSIPGGTDLTVLPEMFTTGFTMNAAALAQNMDGGTVAWIREMSARRGMDITGSMIIKEGGNFYNRLIWAGPGGKLHVYDKKHLFRYAGEEKVYAPGNSNITVELKGWRFRPFICYDLRFPVWARNVNNDYHAALYVANWPESRSLHWKTLLRARAIENQCYVIGVNRVGLDGNGILYSGDSMVINFRGGALFEKQHETVVHSFTLSMEELLEYRKNFPAWMDADFDMVKS